ncbi:MAG TPA: SDR family oxidoreductase [Vicinamibacteria bacterium]|nr:SDR family oxidoreductase [Vicinamibacteria bacterium]
MVLVTGCSSGIGLAVAREAARAGHVVYAGLRDPASGPAPEADFVPVALDVTRAAEREAAVARVVREQGRLDVLVNNAGVALGGFLEQVEEDELRHVFDVNVFGAWAMTRAALPQLRAARGLVVFMSSMSGRTALPGLGAYAASKFGLEALGEAWRHELAPLGVRVVLVEPGAYRTEIFGRNRRLGRRVRDAASPYAPRVERLDALARRTAERLARDPAEVARLVVSLFDARRPRLRYPIGPGARLRTVLLRVAPFSLVEAIVRRTLRPGDQGRNPHRE